jgi:hypothetical protein
MLARFIARAALASLSFLLTLGNYWFTFGLWPKSWIAFAGFWFAGLSVMAFQVILSMEKDEK